MSKVHEECCGHIPFGITKTERSLGSVVRFPLACVLGSVPDGEEVDDPGGEIQSHVRLTVDHRDAVSVAIAGSGHTATEQQERRPTRTDAEVKVRLSLPKD